MSFRELLQQREIHDKQIKLREKKIKQKLKKAQMQKLNIQNDQKVGKIDKIKYIRKKKLEVIQQKRVHQPTKLMDNITISTFSQKSEGFKKILSRTENYIQFNHNKVRDACQAICNYALQKRQKVVDICIKMENEISCSIRPFQIKLAYPNQSGCQVIVIAHFSEKQKQKVFGCIKDLNLKIMGFSEFLSKISSKQDKSFSRKIKSKQCYVFCDFEIFKSRIQKLQRLLAQGFLIFPISCDKIPFGLRQSLPDYSSYFRNLLQHEYSILKSGKQQQKLKQFSLIRLKTTRPQLLAQNAMTGIHQHVAKLIERNTNKTSKSNRVYQISIKSISSSPLNIYSLGDQSGKK